MATKIQIQMTVPNLTTAQFDSIVPIVDAQSGYLSLGNYFRSVASGVQDGANTTVYEGAVNATGLITITSTGPTNSQTCTIGAVTFTAVTSGATGNQFNINATAGTVAANLAAAINASANLAGKITATASGTSTGIVTLTSVVPGLIGNALSLANVNLSNTTMTAFASGSNGTSYTLNLS